MKLVYTEFTNNMAYQAGAILVDNGGFLEGDHPQFYKNLAIKSAGCIQVLTNSYFNIYNALFSEN